MLYRAMLPDPNDPTRPLLVTDSSTSSGLGIRRSDRRDDDFFDIRVVHGRVSAGEGGLSVAVGDPRELPMQRLPKSFGGRGPDPLWAMNQHDLPEGLTLRVDPDRPGKGYVEPVADIGIEEYEHASLATVRLWKRMEAP